MLLPPPKGGGFPHLNNFMNADNINFKELYFKLLGKTRTKTQGWFCNSHHCYYNQSGVKLYEHCYFTYMDDLQIVVTARPYGKGLFAKLFPVYMVFAGPYNEANDISDKRNNNNLGDVLHNSNLRQPEEINFTDSKKLYKTVRAVYGKGFDKE